MDEDLIAVIALEELVGIFTSPQNKTEGMEVSKKSALVLEPLSSPSTPTNCRSKEHVIPMAKIIARTYHEELKHKKEDYRRVVLQKFMGGVEKRLPNVVVDDAMEFLWQKQELETMFLKEEQGYELTYDRNNGAYGDSKVTVTVSIPGAADMVSKYEK